ncbi:hypothetical protein KC343_g4550 [Hortaea werneckii]|nr:hypothetical protein KC352_g10792 [Hortaea werneckii]KAI7630562.1 hypothetical protein KC343_g4550 [Hortaea werneckii]
MLFPLEGEEMETGKMGAEKMVGCFKANNSSSSSSSSSRRVKRVRDEGHIHAHPASTAYLSCSDSPLQMRFCDRPPQMSRTVTPTPQ